MTEQELIEALAREEHRGWADWMNHVFDIGKTNEDGSFTIPADYVQRWLRQCCTAYKILSEREKQSDRDEVAHILPIIEAYKSNDGKDISVDKEFFEHLLNCMANQKALPILDILMSDREKETQKVINKAYHEARELLMQSVAGRAERDEGQIVSTLKKKLRWDFPDLNVSISPLENSDDYALNYEGSLPSEETRDAVARAFRRYRAEVESDHA